MEIISRIKARFIIVFASLFSLTLVITSFAKSAPPSLDEVLMKSGPSFDLGSLVFGFFALSLGTLSLAKAYEVFKRPSNKNEETNKDFTDAEIDNLKFKIDEVSSSLGYKNEENESLRDQIFKLEESLKERLNGEELLKKSVASLRKECEKLIVEKEKMNLELSRKNWEDLFGNRDSVVDFKPNQIIEKIEKIIIDEPQAKSVGSKPLKVKAVSSPKKKLIKKAKQSLKKRRK